MFLLINLYAQKTLHPSDFVSQDESSIRNHLRNKISNANAKEHLTDSIANLKCLGEDRNIITL